MEVKPQVSLRDLLFVVLKFRWSVFAIIALTLLVAVFYVLVIRETLYEVSAKILVRIGHEQAPPATIGGQPMVMGYRNQDVNTEIDILQSADLLGLIVDKYGLDKPPKFQPPPPGFLPRLRYETKKVVRVIREYGESILLLLGLREPLTAREKAVAGLQSGFIVTAQKESNVLVAHLLLPVREGTAAVLNAMLDEYLQFRLELYRNLKSEKFFESSESDSRKHLQDVQSHLENFERNNNIQLLAKQKELLLDQIAAAEREMREADRRRDVAADKVRRLEQELNKPEPDVATFGLYEEGSLPQKLIGELTELQSERERMRMTELDSSARIQNNRARFRTLINMLASNLRTSLGEEEARAKSQTTTLARLNERLEQLHQQEGEWQNLTRERTLAEESYLLFHRKHQETTTDAALDEGKVGNVVVIERAIDPLKPTGMRKSLMLGIALVLALFAALAWVSLAEFFDHSIYSASQLEEVAAVTAFGEVPRLSKRERMRESE